MKPEFYVPRDVRAITLTPYGGGGRVYGNYKFRVPEVLSSSSIIFTPVTPDLKDSVYQHHAAQGYMGIKAPNNTVILVKESEISFDIPENFDELRDQAEEELEEELAELGYNPFESM